MVMTEMKPRIIFQDGYWVCQREGSDVRGAGVNPEIALFNWWMQAGDIL
jgi:hypothetical protein